MKTNRIGSVVTVVLALTLALTVDFWQADQGKAGRIGDQKSARPPAKQDGSPERKITPLDHLVQQVSASSRQAPTP